MATAQESRLTEISKLKVLIETERGAVPRRPFTSEVRARVLKLWRGGVTPKTLTAELGLAASVVYAWARQAPAANQRVDPPVQVLPVQADPPSARPEIQGSGNEVQLRVGAFVLTIALAGW